MILSIILLRPNNQVKSSIYLSSI